jgi:hypothetical protein
VRHKSCANRGRNLLPFCLQHVGDEDLGAFGAKQTRFIGALSTRTTGDECYFALQSRHVICSWISRTAVATASG